MWRVEPRGGKLTEREVRELAAIDGVLTGGRIDELDADQKSLARIVEAVRADHPPLRPAFAQELAARLRTGPPPGRAGSPDDRVRSAQPGPGLGLLRRTDRRSRLVGLGAASSAVAVAAVLLAGFGSAGRSTAPRPAVPGGSTSGSAAAVAQPSLRGPAPPVSASGSSPTSGPAIQGLAAPGAGRALQSDASLSLLTPAAHLQRVSGQATAAIDRVGGIVESSSVVVENQGQSQATISARVPVANLEGVLAALSSLADVTSRSQNTLDITDPTGVARQQLAQSRAERSALLRQLASASTPNEVASIDAQLGLVAGRIGQDEKDLQRLVDQARYATLSVAIAESGSAAGGGGGGSAWTPNGAVHDAVTVLEAVFAILVIGIAGLLPAGGVGALVWWSARTVRRRRRQGALAA